MRSMLLEREIPVVGLERTPIWFVKVGAAEATAEVVRGLMDDGFYTNPATFPALPLGSAGVRFTQTLHHSDEDLRRLVDAIARRLPAREPQIVIDLTDSTQIDTAMPVELTESNT